jgi:hypothetical protein
MFSRFAGCRDHIPPKESEISDAADVRFGSLADIGASLHDVRFTPKSGHRLTTVEVSGCSNRPDALQLPRRAYSDRPVFPWSVAANADIFWIFFTGDDVYVTTGAADAAALATEMAAIRRATSLLSSLAATRPSGSSS